MSDPVQEIKNKADIVDLISEIIPVKRSGSSYLALCPFHNDSKPSMHISSSKGIYKCFACGAGGDLFKFWSEYYQKDFKETLRDLAEKYGVDLPQYNPQEKQEKNLQLKLHNLAAEFYHQKLLLDNHAHKAREYLKQRALSTQTIAKFKLGYAVSTRDEKNLLIKHLKSKLPELKDEDLLEAGLAYKKDDKPIIDRFRSRLMIPIFDEQSRCIAFGARTLDDEFGPKYINSPETNIYTKGDQLYGIDLAKESIRKKDAAILVEGFFDVISLEQAGFHNVVANQGTALTANQIKKLVKFTTNKKIYLCLDTDEAGQKATDAAAKTIAETLANHDYELRVIKVPGGKDADEYIKEHSLESFEEIVRNAPYYLDHKIEAEIAKCDLNDSFAKEKTAKILQEHLNSVQKEIVKIDYAKKIADKLSIPESFFNLKTNTQQYQANPYEDRDKPKEQHQKKYEVNQYEIELLAIFLASQTSLEEFLAKENEMNSLETNKVLQAIIDVVFENPEITNHNQRFEILQKNFKELEIQRILAEIGFNLENLNINDNLDENYKNLEKRLKEQKLKSELNKLKLDMRSYEPNSQAWMEIYQRKLEKTREIQALK